MDNSQNKITNLNRADAFRFNLIFAFVVFFAMALFSLSASARPLVLDWEDVTWTPPGNTNLSETYTVGGRDIVVSFAGNTAGLDSAGTVVSPQLDASNTGGLLPPEQSLVIGTDYADLSNPEVSVTLDFSSYPGGVSDVSFSIFDVDAFLSFIDEVEVTAQTAAGTVDPTAIVTSVDNQVVNSNTIIGIDSSPADTADGNAQFTFGQSGITSVTLVYRNPANDPNPGFQWIHVHDISFEAELADISVVKDVNNPTPTQGTDVVYTITVANDGPDAGTGLEVTDQLPAGLTYVSDNGGGAYDDATGIWTIGTLAVGATTTLQITATVNPTGPYDNVAELTNATSDDIDSTPGNNDPTEDDQDNALIVPSLLADLSLTKTVDTIEPVVGDNVTFTISVTNDGLGATTGVTVSDQLPSGLVYVSDTPSVGAYDDATGIWTIGAMAVGATETLQIVATVLATGDYGNVAEVATSDIPDPDSTPGNNVPTEDDQALAQVTPILIGIAKSISSTVVNNGNGSFTFDYSLLVENAGAAELINLQVVDDLAATFAGATAFTVDAIASGDFTINPVYNGVADINLLAGTDTLVVGGTGNIVITVTVTPGANLGPYNNSATANATGPAGTPVTDVSQTGIDPDPDNDGDPRNNNDPTPVSFTESPIIGLAKRVSTAPVADGTGGFTLTYTMVVENLGDVPLSQLQVTDNFAQTFAAATSFIVTGISSADFTVNAAFDGVGDTNLLAATDTLASGASGEIAIDMTVRPGANLGPYINTAVTSGVSPAGTPVSDQSTDGVATDPDNDGDPGNNSVPTPVSFAESPLIGTAKQVVAGPLNNGDGTFTFEYQIRVQNYGDVTLSGVQITDDFAAAFAAAGGFTVNSLTSNDLSINPGFNGITDINLLDGTDGLVVGGFGSVNVNITLDPAGNFGQYDNSATGSGTSPAGTLVQDISEDGVDPDTNGDNDPTNDNTPTPIVLSEAPGIGIAKRVTAPPVSNNNGSFTFSYTMSVTNFGDVVLSAVQVTDDLATTFAQAGSFVVNAVQSGDFATNAGYNGTSNTDLLAGTDVLAVGGTGEILVTLTVTPGSFSGPYLNTAVATGTSPGGTPVQDDSTDGVDPDPDNDGDPGNNTVPTPVSFALPNIVVTKRADPQQTSVGGLVRYTVTVENTGGGALNDITLQDLIPAGFTYAQGSARLMGSGNLTVDGQRPVAFGGINLNGGESATLTYILRVGAGVVQGNYPNIVTPFAQGQPVGDPATASVRIISDPDFEDTTIIGKVFADHNEDGYQDEGEHGIAGVRLGTVEGLRIETDAEGRYHIAGVGGGFPERGRNFIVKVDPATLPSGSTFTTENPRVKRITQGLMNRFDFGVKVPAYETVRTGRIKVKLAEVFFQPHSDEVHPDFTPAISELAGLLREHGGGILYIDGNADPCAKAAPPTTYTETDTLSYTFTPHFGVRKAVLTADDKIELDRELSSWRDARDVSILSIGHTSSVRIAPENRHEFADNYVLGEARAAAVAKYVSESLGISSTSVRAIGKGPDEPVADNATFDGRAKNRRVELILSGQRVAERSVPGSKVACDIGLGERRAKRVFESLRPLIGEDLINDVQVLPKPPTH